LAAPGVIDDASQGRPIGGLFVCRIGMVAPTSGEHWLIVDHHASAVPSIPMVSRLLLENVK